MVPIQKKMARRLRSRAKLREESVLRPQPKKGPARQKWFILFTTYLREYGDKILKIICRFRLLS